LHYALRILASLMKSNYRKIQTVQIKRKNINLQPLRHFKLEIYNLQRMADKKDLHLVVAHRFGSIRGGIKELFGLDQANTKIQLLYGISNRIQLGVSRDSYEKTYSGTAKLKCLQQSDKMPINLVLYTSVDVNTLLSNKTYPRFIVF